MGSNAYRKKMCVSLNLTDNLSSWFYLILTLPLLRIAENLHDADKDAYQHQNLKPEIAHTEEVKPDLATAESV